MASVQPQKSALGPAPVGAVSLVEYQPGAIVSRQLLKNAQANLTLFAFDQGQELSEHTSVFNALVLVLEGQARITVAGRSHSVGAGRMVLMPAGQPHAVKATKRFKMLLTLVRP